MVWLCLYIWYNFLICVYIYNIFSIPYALPFIVSLFTTIINIPPKIDFDETYELCCDNHSTSSVCRVVHDDYDCYSEELFKDVLVTRNDNLSTFMISYFSFCSAFFICSSVYIIYLDVLLLCYTFFISMRRKTYKSK